jgi:hypothetical protein
MTQGEDHTRCWLRLSEGLDRWQSHCDETQVLTCPALNKGTDGSNRAGYAAPGERERAGSCRGWMNRLAMGKLSAESLMRAVSRFPFSYISYFDVTQTTGTGSTMQSSTCGLPSTPSMLGTIVVRAKIGDCLLHDRSRDVAFRGWRVLLHHITELSGTIAIKLGRDSLDLVKGSDAA